MPRPEVDILHRGKSSGTNFYVPLPDVWKNISMVIQKKANMSPSELLGASRKTYNEEGAPYGRIWMKAHLGKPFLSDAYLMIDAFYEPDSSFSPVFLDMQCDIMTSTPLVRTVRKKIQQFDKTLKRQGVHSRIALSGGRVLEVSDGLGDHIATMTAQNYISLKTDMKPFGEIQVESQGVELIQKFVTVTAYVTDALFELAGNPRSDKVYLFKQQAISL